MWIDDRGSEVLPLAECRRLLALAAKQHHHGHLGVATADAPVVLPLDFGVHGAELVLRVGDGLFEHVDGRLVAFQVDNSSYGDEWAADGSEGRWSVLVRGLATEFAPGPDGPAPTDLPLPRVAEPGRRLVRLRPDIVTGRRLRHPSSDGCTAAS